MIVTIADFRGAGMCASGARRGAKIHGIDWSDFLANGIDSDVLLAKAGSLAVPVIEAARKRLAVKSDAELDAIFDVISGEKSLAAHIVNARYPETPDGE